MHSWYLLDANWFMVLVESALHNIPLRLHTTQCLRSLAKSGRPLRGIKLKSANKYAMYRLRCQLSQVG
jgi:hypothetical protein